MLHTLMHNLRLTKRRLIIGTSFHTSRSSLGHVVGKRPTKRPTKRNETTGRLRIKPSGSGDENGRGRRG